MTTFEPSSESSPESGPEPTQTEIAQKLNDLCQAHDLRLLYSCESGSRAWDMASPDSDWDIRFLFVHPLPAYLALDAPFEALNQMDGLLDYGGWELRKALILLRSSNAAVFEWLNSPIIYHRPEPVIVRLQELAHQFFSPRKVAHHYLGLTRKYLPRLEAPYTQAQPPRLKDFFYALRAMLSAQWVMTRETAPPLPLPELLPQISEPGFENALLELLSAKRLTAEQALCPVPDIVLDWLRGQFQQLETHVDGLPVREGNSLFLEAILLEALSQR